MVENEQDFIGIANTIAYQLSSQIWALCTVACCATHVEFSPEWVMDIFGFIEGSIIEGNRHFVATNKSLIFVVGFIVHVLCNMWHCGLSHLLFAL